MKRFYLLFITLFLVISIFLIIIQFNKPEINNIEVLQEAFGKTGADVVTSEVYILGRADNKYDSGEKREQLIYGLAAAAAGNPSYKKPALIQLDNDNILGTESDFSLDENINIHISVLKNRQDESEKNYQVSVNLTDTSSRQEVLAGVAGKLSRAYGRYGIKPDVNICITGSINGELKDSELDTICSEVFKSTEANKVEGIKDNGLISVSAFSPSIRDAVRVNGKRVNLNIAVRYNSYEEKTYIWLATPVITTEY